ncbi:hypothetical protein [Bradyrhizobium sp. CCGUVB14]|uniref:hypothetical protein n=1 Tax=Bradyrhizobium sp. CCGUVB14 TaxID=2949628 RepID=UPI0020B1D6D6|nr:hypothetical protein [Bradyrhizobium sp. CCGUVB14]MCP3443279.1 hypothetical protein [Bradyrhizobium sp. CCGUVB14]
MIGQADFVVVDLGAMGSSILYQLAKRGAHAIGIDRFAPPGAGPTVRKRNSFC